MTYARDSRVQDLAVAFGTDQGQQNAAIAVADATAVSAKRAAGIHLAEFGVPGSASLQALINYLAINGGVGLLPTDAVIELDTRISHQTLNANPFAIMGHGGKARIKNIGIPNGHVVTLYNKTGVIISDIEIDANVAAFPGISTAFNGAHFTDVSITRLEVKNTGTYGGWVISGSDQVTNFNVHLTECVMRNTGASAFQIQGARNSGYRSCSAYDCGGRNSDSAGGPRFKTPVHDCYMTDMYAENIVGVAFGCGSSFPAVTSTGLSFKGLRCKNAGGVFAIGRCKDVTIEVVEGNMSGATSHPVYTFRMGTAFDFLQGASDVTVHAQAITGVPDTVQGYAALMATEVSNCRVQIERLEGRGVTTAVVFGLFAGTGESNLVVVNKLDNYRNAVSINRSGSSWSIARPDGASHAGQVRLIAGGVVSLLNAADVGLYVDQSSDLTVTSLATITAQAWSGRRITLSIMGDARPVTVATSGNITPRGNTSVLLDSAAKILTLEWNDRTNKWVEVSRSWA